jgi:hypothetical protein
VKEKYILNADNVTKLKTSKNPLKKNLKRFYTPNIGDPIF